MRRPRSKFRPLSQLVLAASFVGAFAYANDAEAKPNITRKGGQWGVMLGGSACIPGKAKCNRDQVTENGVTIDGKTRPSFGLGAELGYRFNKFVFLGAAYNLGFFDTSYEVIGGEGYKRAYQNSVYGVVRPILPLWRFDLGLGLGPGFSRQTFVFDNGDKDYSQGFSFKIAPTIDIFVSQRIFIGAKLDLLLNGHRRVCHEVGDDTACTTDREQRDLAPVHQMVFGLHVGGTFL